MTGRGVCHHQLAPMKPFALMMLCRRRLGWYQRVHPETPDWMRTVILPVHLAEDGEGNAHFTIVTRCAKHHGLLAELPLEYVFRFALDLAANGREH